jgi:hypothetical protein
VSELGLTGGVTYYIGDLNPYPALPQGHQTGRMAVVYRYNFSDRYAVRLQGT